MGRCEGRPHSYVHMPFSLPNQATLHQRHIREVLAPREARHQEILAEVASVLRELWEPPEPREAPETGGS